MQKPKILIPQIWDTPYDVDGGDNQDLFPLVEETDLTTELIVQNNEQISSKSSNLNIETTSNSPCSNHSSLYFFINNINYFFCFYTTVHLNFFQF